MENVTEGEIALPTITADYLKPEYYILM